MAGRFGREIVTVDPIDFLQEAVDDFLQSAERSRSIASSVIKTAAAIELLIKGKLSDICPALILDRVDPQGLQIIKVHALGKQLRDPKLLERVELKTVPFPVLLDRFALFFDVDNAVPDLKRLFRIRNSLVHHSSGIDMLETNLLMVRGIFPFIRDLIKGRKDAPYRIGAKKWQRLRELEKTFVNSLAGSLAKKIAHYEALAEEIPAARTELLAKSVPELHSKDEEVLDDGLLCPACGREALTCFRAYDVDYDEGGVSAAYSFLFMQCKVCGLFLEEDEMHYVYEHFSDFVTNPEDRPFWGQVFEQDTDSEYQ